MSEEFGTLSPERIGRATASRIKDIIAKTKTGYGASRANYLAELVAERLTGEPYPSFQNPSMKWGNDTEPMARAAYAMHVGEDVHFLGFVRHPAIEMAGASPDGGVGKHGLVELKCPNTATHIDLLRGGPWDGGYIAQGFWQMACTGREWCDLVSFDPRMPENMQLFVNHIKRDDQMIAALEREVIIFLDEVAKTVNKLQEQYCKAEAT